MFTCRNRRLCRDVPFRYVEPSGSLHQRICGQGLWEQSVWIFDIPGAFKEPKYDKVWVPALRAWKREGNVVMRRRR